MDPFIKTIFLDEVKIQCEFALMSMNYLRGSLQRRDITDIHTRIMMVFHQAHAFLIHVANLSKLFWPDRKTIRKWPNAKIRGEELRKILKISENSPIKNRRFRNHFEHYDDRIEEWAVTSQRKNYADMNIMTPGGISGIDIKDFMRNLDPNALILTFHGDSYDLIDAESEIKRIFKILIGSRTY